MQISVRAHVEGATQFLADVHRRHVPFASILAATMTAKAVKVEEIRTMREVFDRPTPYVLNSLRVSPATKSDPVASVEFKDFTTKGVPAKRFLNPNINGGGRSQKSHELLLATVLGSSYATPGRDMPLDQYGNLSGALLKRIVSQLRSSSDPMQNASGSAKSKRNRRANAFYKLKDRPIIMQRIGKDQVRPALIGVKAPHYQARFPFYEVAERVVEREYPRAFVEALERAIAKGNSRGKW